MEVKPDDKKVVLYVEELSSDKPGKVDEVQEYLESQNVPEGEKIEIPTGNVSKKTEVDIEAAE
jgi:hypothetical protein